MVGIRELIQSAAPILEALHDGVAVTDAKGVVVYVNEANTRITGLRPDQLVNRPVQAVVPHSHLLDAIHSGRTLIGVRTKVAGREVISNIVPLWDGGNLAGAVSIFRDLSEVLRLDAQLQEARNTIALLQVHLGAGEVPDGMVLGRSPAAQRAFTLAMRAATVSSAVLIEGESGTGKEIYARLIHARSDRATKPFLAVNCAAVPGSLLESELFGYEEGAFTGARRGGRAGFFEMADGGTLFLDEVGDMEPSMQAKLLRVLQDGEFRRLGSTAVRRSKVRILSATNRSLADLVAQHHFREDLYYRLRVIRIALPCLRERREDLPAFIEHAMQRAAARLCRPPAAVDGGALRLLLGYGYPGNVRELENLLEQALVLDDDGVIGTADLPMEIVSLSMEDGGHGFWPTKGLRPPEEPAWQETERALLEGALRTFRTRVAMAEHLGISRATLYRRLAKYGLT